MRRAAAALAALACALAVALGAWAAHAAQPQDRQRLALAAAFAFGHGLALLALHARAGRLADAARLCFLLGIGAFSGSLAAAVVLGTPTTLAPAGGSLLLLGWLLAAADFLTRD
jgi:uncharacterized membrane protein YgdD (TMEM256/DUF423 family)